MELPLAARQNDSESVSPRRTAHATGIGRRMNRRWARHAPRANARCLRLARSEGRDEASIPIACATEIEAYLGPMRSGDGKELQEKRHVGFNETRGGQWLSIVK